MLNKDLYEYLCSFVDDKTIINLLSVNRKYNECFERIVIRKYPYLVKFKKDKSWKKFFVEQALAISRIEEDYGIPYFLNEDYNPSDFYFWSCVNDDRVEIYEIALKEAIKTNVVLLKQVINKFIEDFDQFRFDVQVNHNLQTEVHIRRSAMNRSQIIRFAIQLAFLSEKQDMIDELIICYDYFEKYKNK